MRKKDLVEIHDYIQAHRTVRGPFDLVLAGSTPGSDSAKARKIISPFVDAGLTWWLESLFGRRNSAEAMRARIQQGPPNLK